jgi:hypothetical protein
MQPETKGKKMNNTDPVFIVLVFHLSWIFAFKNTTILITECLGSLNFMPKASHIPL